MPKKFTSNDELNKIDNKINTEMSALKDLFLNKIVSKSGVSLSASTVSNYVSKINRLCLEVTGKPFKMDTWKSWMLKPDEVIKKLSDSNLSSKKDFISGLTKFLKHENAPEDILTKYRDAMTKFKEHETKVRGDNLASTKQVENNMSVEDINKRISKFKVENDQDLADKLIVQLYFQNTLVPRNELYLWKYASKSKRARDMNKKFNYVVLDGTTPIEIIYNFYKSRGKYGQNIKFPITDKVKTTFKEYVERTGGKAGDYVFLMNTKDSNGENKPFTDANFSNVVKSAMKHVLGKEITPNLARQIQITDFYTSGLKSQNQEDEDSKRFLHSSAMHRTYAKVNLAEDKEVESGDEQ